MPQWKEQVVNCVPSAAPSNKPPLISSLLNAIQLGRRTLEPFSINITIFALTSNLFHLPGCPPLPFYGTTDTTRLQYISNPSETHFYPHRAIKHIHHGITEIAASIIGLSNARRPTDHPTPHSPLPHTHRHPTIICLSWLSKQIHAIRSTTSNRRPASSPPPAPKHLDTTKHTHTQAHTTVLPKPLRIQNSENNQPSPSSPFTLPIWPSLTLCPCYLARPRSFNPLCCLCRKRRLEGTLPSSIPQHKRTNEAQRRNKSLFLTLARPANPLIDTFPRRTTECHPKSVHRPPRYITTLFHTSAPVERFPVRSLFRFFLDLTPRKTHLRNTTWTTL
ncbi:uncharacterized protein CLUP02_05205 [Colletotrichum lupini]|uniref:Uncharacterized protein n=1 Tax=Colletotrichum lupini TaxID=145971 RepID=A0A9Q8SM68_9PEZI|nr:uncharacterized protein CLUP02_05205 [Colletotrichum lupini]UQC79725.1 hypothetical protein CLUP02_05205 [Colletotrichum lupini]